MPKPKTPATLANRDAHNAAMDDLDEGTVTSSLLKLPKRRRAELRFIAHQFGAPVSDIVRERLRLFVLEYERDYAKITDEDLAPFKY